MKPENQQRGDSSLHRVDGRTGAALASKVERGGEREALLAIDKTARDGAAYCWDKASSTEAVNVGDRFWKIHCELLKLIEGGEGQGEGGNDSEPSHSPIAIKLSDGGGLARRLRGGLCGEQPP